MTTAASEVLKAFDALPLAERQEVAVEILRRSAPADELPEGAFEELAAELFCGYDAEEAGHAGP